MTSMPVTMVSQETDTRPLDRPNQDKGAVHCPTSRSKLFGCAPAAVADVLDRAADRIHANGFWQGDPNATDGDCGVSAIRSVELYGALAEAAIQALAAHLRLPVIAGAAANAVIDWNDTPGRTAAEVCAEMRACAAGLRITSDAFGYRTVSLFGVTA